MIYSCAETIGSQIALTYPLDTAARMPSERPSISAKRKAPAFKPPRPAAKPKNPAKAAPRRKSAPTHAPVSLSSSEDEDVEGLSHSPAVEATKTLANLNDPPPTIPPQLLTKLLHHHFSDAQTRVGKDANAVVGKYMETFVREALARAAFERSEADGTRGRGGDFLEASAPGVTEDIFPMLTCFSSIRSRI